MPTAISQPAASIPAILERAGQWFLSSGIQVPDGGVARYYLVEEGRNKRTSTEITGYSVSAMAFLHQRTGDPALLDGAQRAADLLARSFDESLELFPFEYPPSQMAEENRAYFFDCGIIIRGILHLNRLRPNASLVDLALRCGRSMAARFEHQNQYAPILQLPLAEPLPYGSSWSNNPGCYQLKSALGWLGLAKISSDAAPFAQSFATACARAHASDFDFLPGTSERLRVMDRLHAYCYYLEALLACGDAVRLQAGIRRVATYLREIRPEFVRSDVYAQLLRVRILAAHAGLVTLNEPQAAEEAAAIPGFQYQSPDPRLDGGFSFGKRNGHDLMPFANPVSTAFCSQALAFWDEHRSGGRFRYSWEDLI